MHIHLTFQTLWTFCKISDAIFYYFSSNVLFPTSSQTLTCVALLSMVLFWKEIRFVESKDDSIVKINLP